MARRALGMPRGPVLPCLPQAGHSRGQHRMLCAGNPADCDRFCSCCGPSRRAARQPYGIRHAGRRRTLGQLSPRVALRSPGWAGHRRQPALADRQPHQAISLDPVVRRRAQRRERGDLGRNAAGPAPDRSEPLRFGRVRRPRWPVPARSCRSTGDRARRGRRTRSFGVPACHATDRHWRLRGPTDPLDDVGERAAGQVGRIEVPRIRGLPVESVHLDGAMRLSPEGRGGERAEHQGGEQRRTPGAHHREPGSELEMPGGQLFGVRGRFWWR